LGFADFIFFIIWRLKVISGGLYGNCVGYMGIKMDIWGFVGITVV